MFNDKLLYFLRRDSLRKEVSNCTPFGQNISTYLSSGKLIPDRDIDIYVLKQLLTINSDVILLDGYPRTASQCATLNNFNSQRFSPKTLAIELSVPEWVVVDKMLGRRKCVNCNSDFNICDIRRNGFDMPPILPDPATCKLGYVRY